MIMTPEQREQLRLSLLRFCGNNPTRFGLPVGYLTAMAASEGRPGLTPNDVATEMQYLEDKGLVTAPSKEISPENVAWRITASGRDYLAERGIA